MAGYETAIDVQIDAAKRMRVERANLLPKSAAEYADAILNADTYYLEPDFMLLVDHATETFPEAATVLESDFASPTGWITFGSPMVGKAFEDGGLEDAESPLVGMFWEIEDALHALLLFHIPADGIGMYRLHLGEVDPFCFCRSTLNGLVDWDRRVKTLWTLLGQRQVAEEGDLRPPRSAVRRAERAGVRPSVRVIRLPQVARTSGGSSTVQWQHRWVVSGHWRQQPWGLARRSIRAVWIAPHLKGPSDKPLLAQAHRLFVAGRETPDALA